MFISISFSHKYICILLFKDDLLCFFTFYLVSNVSIWAWKKSAKFQNTKLFQSQLFSISVSCFERQTLTLQYSSFNSCPRHIKKSNRGLVALVVCWNLVWNGYGKGMTFLKHPQNGWPITTHWSSQSIRACFSEGGAS